MAGEGEEGGNGRGADGGEEAVWRSSFTGMSGTMDEKRRAGKAECQLAGSAVKNAGSESTSYFSIEVKKLA